MSSLHVLRPVIRGLQNNGISKVAQSRLANKDIIPLWFGEGDLPTDDIIKDAAKRALEANEVFYSNTRGRAELRGAIKAYLDDLYGLDLDYERITIPGSTMLAINITSQMALTEGDHGLVVSPAWPNIVTAFSITGAEVEHVRQRQDGGSWKLDLEELIAAIRPNTRAIFVNTPCNPTGWVMPREEQEALVAVCRERGILLIADEVYHRTVYDMRAAPSFLSVAEPDDPVVVISGFSKAWAMTGWRIGWLVAPAAWGERLAALSECFNTGAPTFVQLAAMAALERGEPRLNEMLQQYAGGRDIVMQYLGQHPRIEIVRPDGAFYAFPRLPGLADSLSFCERLADEEQVGIAPGYTFGPQNDSHFRLCFALSHDRLREACERLVAFVDAWPE
ncbi:MAG: pyridoxal phosphate-dependent aminotransferase [Pseudomonadota bacterium]